jgi:hypothetical protein
MDDTQADKESAPGKWNFITVSIIGVVLVVAVIWLARALNNSSPQGSVAPAGKDTTMNTGLSQEEIERQHEMAELRTAPAVQAPVAAPPAVIPTNQHNDEVILQKAKAKVNQRIVDRMKQYVRDNPNRDTWDIKEQIKKRENMGAQSQ